MSHRATGRARRLLDRDGRGAVDRDVALVLQTSGTTARHKVVALTQAQVLWSARVVDLEPDDRCLGEQRAGSVGIVQNLDMQVRDETGGEPAPRRAR